MNKRETEREGGGEREIRREVRVIEKETERKKGIESLTVRKKGRNTERHRERGRERYITQLSV